MPSPFSVLASIAERRIQEAQEQGQFEELPGAGKPLHLEDDSMVPEELRMAYKMLRNAGYIPPELAERKEISTLVELLENCVDAQERVRQMQKLQCILRKVAAKRHQPIHLEENDPYYSQILERVALMQRRIREENSSR